MAKEDLCTLIFTAKTPHNHYTKKKKNNNQRRKGIWIPTLSIWLCGTKFQSCKPEGNPQSEKCVSVSIHCDKLPPTNVCIHVCVSVQQCFDKCHTILRGKRWGISLKTQSFTFVTRDEAELILKQSPHFDLWVSVTAAALHRSASLQRGLPPCGVRKQLDPLGFWPPRFLSTWLGTINQQNVRLPCADTVCQ